ncbi:MAG: hypothetical protein HYU78_18210 [Rhodocyclales bacterium]|nr:hypothetical protein [Rhodocyclales bacterium]
MTADNTDETSDPAVRSAHLDNLFSLTAEPMAARGNQPTDRPAAARQTINDVLEHGQAPSEELLDELRALECAPSLSDDELERQALAHPGGDGDPGTPE